MSAEVSKLDPGGLRQFAALRADAINAVTERFYRDHRSIYASYGEKGRAACSEDLAFHLEFLRPALEFGLLAPMVEYLRWLGQVLATRDVPAEHLAQSLDWLAEFFAAKMTPPVSQVVVATLRAARAQFLEEDASEPAIYARLPFAWPECVPFEAALLEGDRLQAMAMLERRLAQGSGLVDAELHMIQPALYGIGRKWQANQVSVAQEHLATAIAQSVMTSGMLRSVPSAPIGRKVLLACVSGNHHALGLQMVADAFQLAGWDVNYLGADVPTPALVQHAGAWQADLVGLSVSFAQQLRVVKEVIAAMDQTLGERRPAVIIGGLAINGFPALASHSGADTWSPDAAAAVVSGNDLAMRL